jgi:hypothetical protein
MLENLALAKFKQTYICIPEESKRKEKTKSTANDNDKCYMRAAGS